MRELKQSFRGIVAAISVAFFLLTVNLQQVCAQQVLSDTKKKAVESTTTEQQDDAFSATSAQEEKSGDTNKWLMYGGAAALVVGVAAVAAGSGGGGGDSTPACAEELVGPDLNGNTWAGTLDLYDYGSQAVTAIVTHCGNRVLIQTTSTLRYGQEFEGTIKSSGYLDMIETPTQQEWTSYRGNASSTQIRIYDFVNNFHDFDSLELYRSAQ